MKKRLFLVLFSAVLILTNINYIRANAAVLLSDYNTNYSVKRFDGKVKINVLNKSIIVNEEIAQEILATIQVYMYIENNWDNIKVIKDMDLYNVKGRAVGKPGDILLAIIDLDNISVNGIIAGTLTSHVAMVDQDPTKVLEVMLGGVQNLENDWRTRYKKMLVLRPKTDKKTIMGAIAYGHTKLNTPLAFDFINKTRTDKFYCSQFVWRCYFNNGLDLDCNGGKAVFPYDFIGNKVSVVYKQG
jgi:uncharacterized protein YycO